MSHSLTCAVIFPGQGAQAPGMSHPWREHPRFQALVTEAETQLQLPLAQLMQTGPDELLTRTEIAQPAIFVCSYAIFDILQHETGLKPVAVAGHSLGEYTALCAAGVLSFPDALRLVALRGRLMQQACTRFPGGMAAVVRADQGALENLLREYAGAVVIGNYNSPQQYVLSGAVAPLATVSERIRALKLGRVLPLKVAGAFHSSLMAEAQTELTRALETTDFQPARYPVVSNVDGEASTAPDQLRAKLQRHLLAPVQWEATVRRLRVFSEHFLEPGPGHILSGLVRQTLPEAHLLTPPDLWSPHSHTGVSHV